MHIEVSFPGSVEFELQKADQQGFKGVPIFYGAGSDATCAIIKTFDSSGKVLNMSVLKVSGRTGKFHVMDRTKPVEPSLERKRASAAAPKPEVKK